VGVTATVERCAGTACNNFVEVDRRPYECSRYGLTARPPTAIESVPMQPASWGPILAFRPPPLRVIHLRVIPPMVIPPLDTIPTTATRTPTIKLKGKMQIDLKWLARPITCAPPAIAGFREVGHTYFDIPSRTRAVVCH
jgi:hypothetical protein